jgi:hypothetical protein
MHKKNEWMYYGGKITRRKLGGREMGNGKLKIHTRRVFVCM